MAAEFDEAYVKKLRDEAASWRIKYRELETQQTVTEVSLELAKRGIQADPSWVTIEEGQSINEAIDSFIIKYPQLESSTSLQNNQEEFPKPRQKQKMTPKPIAPSTVKSNTPKPIRATKITKRNIDEIKKDPQARAALRDLYREYLKQGSNQGE